MIANFTPSFDEEKIFWEKGIPHVIGIDEVGRGCFAGPVVVAGVMLDPKCLDYTWLRKIHDSKLLSPILRKTLAPLIQKHCLHFSIKEISVPVINEIGIGKATLLGMQQVVRSCHADNNKIAVLVDAFTIPNIELEQKAIVKGDQKSISIAAASIIAKVYRDALMSTLGDAYADYSFAVNKGYGTKKHREAIRNFGLSDMHRTSFNLEKYLINNTMS